MLAESRAVDGVSIGFSTKSYFGHEQITQWLRQLTDWNNSESIGAFVVPAQPSIERAIQTAPEWLLVGAQDCSAFPAGSQTGEVSAELLSEIGVDFVELGHAERRALGEDDRVIAQKVAQAQQHGLDVLLCVGEESPSSPATAAKLCLRQIEASQVAPASVTIAYEPIWAIGAEQPAPTGHIRETIAGINHALGSAGPRVIYGGTAGPGLLAEIYPEARGLFLGRRAHNPKAFLQVLTEAHAVVHSTP